jgi:class III poly(R)-hydroxyalkanoic acid synthase PhaE subunit
MTTAGLPGAEWLDALRGAPDAYLATARTLWDAAVRAGAQPDAAQRAASFADQLRALHPQFTGAWTAGAMPPGDLFGPMMQGLGGLPGGGAAGPAGAWPAGAGAFARGGAQPSPAPALGLAREHQLAWQRLQQLVAQATQQQAQLAAIWSEIVGAALRELGARVGAAIARGEPPASPRALYDQWIECAEAAFAAAAHGPAFLKAQSALANTSAELRTQQRELVESWARQLDLPTRAELDTVHRRLRALQAQLRGLRASAAVPASRAAPGDAATARPRARRRRT